LDDKRESEWVDRKERKQKDLTIPVYPTDLELVEWLKDFLGCSRAEAVRTSIRSFAAQMRALEKEVGRPRGS
jgi:hypothetical protein